MDRANMRKELERLRAEVEALTSAVNEDEEVSVPQDVEQVSSSTESDESESMFKRQFEELLDLLEHEIRDLPTITCLAVFTLGILLGRNLR